MKPEDYWKRTLGGGVTTRNELVHVAARCALGQVKPIDLVVEVLRWSSLRGALAPGDPLAPIAEQCEALAQTYDALDTEHADALRELVSRVREALGTKTEKKRK